MNLGQEIKEKYGEDAFHLIMTVYVNFYLSELEIIDLCAKWIPRRSNFIEKSYLVHHASDEVKHAKLFKNGIQALGVNWDGLDFSQYRIDDISDRFIKLFESDDELEVLIGLNIYAEGVLALEEIHQLAINQPRYFPDFMEIYKDETTHLAFGAKVAKRLLTESEENRKCAQEHIRWYERHLVNYVENGIGDKIQQAIDCGFVNENYIERLKMRFINVVKSLGLTTRLKYEQAIAV